MQRRWQVLEQEGDRVVHGRGAHEVVVVRDQDTGGGQSSQVVDQAGDQNEKDRVASSTSQPGEPGRRVDGQPGLLTSCGSLELPARHRGDLRHPLPRPDPAPDIPNVPNNTLMVEGLASRARLAGGRVHGESVSAGC